MIGALACLTLIHQPAAIRLWSGDAPLAMGKDAKDVPTLTHFPAKANEKKDAALIIFPGGGYGGLADHEGSGFATVFAEAGYECFVLKYRLGSDGYRNPVMRLDAERAVRLVRSRAQEWKVSPDKIGVIGSSAGGHLAATLATKFSGGQNDSADPVERVSSRPDLAILCYPVITMGPQGHAGSRENLLGRDPSPALIEELSAEKNVRGDTPPCFIWHTADDSVVPVENSLMFAEALSQRKVPYQLHIYEHGHHGLGIGATRDHRGREFRHPWVEAALSFLNGRFGIQP